MVYRKNKDNDGFSMTLIIAQNQNITIQTNIKLIAFVKALNICKMFLVFIAAVKLSLA